MAAAAQGKLEVAACPGNNVRLQTLRGESQRVGSYLSTQRIAVNHNTDPVPATGRVAVAPASKHPQLVSINSTRLQLSAHSVLHCKQSTGTCTIVPCSPTWRGTAARRTQTGAPRNSALSSSPSTNLCPARNRTAMYCCQARCAASSCACLVSTAQHWCIQVFRAYLETLSGEREELQKGLCSKLQRMIMGSLFKAVAISTHEGMRHMVHLLT